MTGLWFNANTRISFYFKQMKLTLGEIPYVKNV